MIKKLLILIASGLFFISHPCNAQSERKSNSSSGNTESSVVEIRYLSLVGDKRLDYIINDLSGKYPEKILGISRKDNSKWLNITYSPSKIQMEDILQLMRAEGISDAYIIQQQQRYFLNNEGRLRSGPSKE